mgnify:CR=1 FL=1
MKKRKLLIGIVATVVVIIIGLSAYLLLTKEDKTTTLNILEKQWIESNKNKRFDFSIVTDIPVFSYEGKGIFLDFLDNIEEVTGLEFNRTSIKLGSKSNSEYGFNIVDSLGDNDILIYEDNYVILSNNGARYENLSQINSLVIGALDSELSNVAYYLKDSNVTFKTCEKVSGLFDAIKNDPKNNIVPVVDAIIIPKNIYLDEILDYTDYNISYNITELSKKYVLTLGDNDRLNDILIKYYKKWSEENFDKKYDDYLLNFYFNASNIDEKQKVQFRSKRYIYGFVDNAPFDIENSGINYQIIKDFEGFSNVEISYQKYNSYTDLINAFNQNDIDFMFNNISNKDYSIDTFSTISNYDENYVVIANKNNNLVINSVNSLLNKNIKVIDNTKISAYLSTQGFEVQNFKNIEQMMQNVEKSDVIVIDYLTYKFYLETYFSDFDLKYFANLSDDYNYLIRDISDNEIFYNLFDFYLSFLNDKEIVNVKYNSISIDNVSKFNYRIVVLIAFILILIIASLILIKIFSKKKGAFNNLSKDDKLKYIDMLTSLKNRNYLNDNIEAWDSSEVYPQTIIIADLNNVAYINDNYGHNEGDNLIKEAANILIKNQIANSEIIRTNGNEFLIYLVGYDEKQIISYIRKLNKEFKELAHGFGVALGYSMINDAIKTIDDAINEATIEMRNNKEEANN